jgi:hypothetical protein
MNKLEKGEFSNVLEENGIRKSSDVPLDYCDICFIAFGSQEKRIQMDEKVVHLDCAKKAKKYF